MKRLPVTEDKLTLILDFLKENNDNAYTRRQVTQYLWDTYSYCDYKTFDQLLREVSDKITKHVNKKNYYVQTVPQQITEHNTFPSTYQYKDVAVNTTLHKIETKPKVNSSKMIVDMNQQLHFEDITNDEKTAINVTETKEEAVLLEDVKASDKIAQTNDNEANLIHWLTNSKDKLRTISHIMKIIADFS